MAAKGSLEDLPGSVFAIAYVLWNTASTFVSKLTVKTGEVRFNTGVFNTCEESTKFLVSFVLLSREQGGRTFGETFAQYKSEITKPNAWRYAVPAALYCFSNNAIFVIFAKLYASEFFVISGLRVGILGVLSWYFFSRTISKKQSAALLTLLAAVTIVLNEMGEKSGADCDTGAPKGGARSLLRERSTGYAARRARRDKFRSGAGEGFSTPDPWRALPDTAEEKPYELYGSTSTTTLAEPWSAAEISDQLLGVVATILLCFSNSFANVWSEMLLKEEKSIYLTNILQYTFTISFNLIVATIMHVKYAPSSNIFYGWGFVHALNVLMNTGDGFLVAFVLKKLDQFVKVVCNQTTSILTVMLEILYFNRHVTKNFIAALVAGACANYLYFN